MFDFAWSEIAVIAVVALVAIGPKDMPVAIRALANGLKKARRMAAEFQTHVDDMVREANLSEVGDQIDSLRNIDIKSTLERHIDPDGALRTTFASNPLEPTSASPATFPGVNLAPDKPEFEAAGDVALAERPEPALESEPEHQTATEPARSAASPAETPAFVPPNAVPPRAPQESAKPEVPAFVPPSIAARHEGLRAL